MKYTLLCTIGIFAFSISYAQFDLKKESHRFHNKGEVKTQVLPPLKDTILNGLVFSLPRNEKSTYVFENEVRKRYQLPPVKLRLFLPNSQPDKPNPKDFSPGDTILLPGKQLYTFNVPNSRFLFENEKGKVYQLPLDNMRCLVPDFKSNMPVVRGFSPELNNEPKIKSVPIHNPLFRNGSKSRKVKKYPRK